MTDKGMGIATISECLHAGHDRPHPTIRVRPPGLADASQRKRKKSRALVSDAHDRELHNDEFFLQLCSRAAISKFLIVCSRAAEL
jgi:hypothetical protein